MNDNTIGKPIEQAIQAQASIGSSFINTVVCEAEDGDMGVAIPAKVVVAKIMEALSKTTLVPITIQVQIIVGAKNVIAENEEACVINQMWSVIIAINMAIMQVSANQKVIIKLPIVLKKIIIANKMKRIMQY